MGGEIFCAVQTVCEAHPAPFAMVTDSFPGKNSRSLVLTTHLLLLSACELVGSVPTLPLCIRIGISWGDLYLYSHITTLTLHYYFFFLFFNQRYNPWWVLACFTISFHNLLSLHFSLQFLTFTFFRSSSTWPSHLSLGLPTGLDEHGSHSVTFLTIIVVSILITCAAHRNLRFYKF